ncbi:hypothetical protein [Dactylosporangium sp. CA-139066]
MFDKIVNAGGGEPVKTPRTLVYQGKTRYQYPQYGTVLYRRQDWLVRQ